MMMAEFMEDSFIDEFTDLLIQRLKDTDLPWTVREFTDEFEEEDVISRIAVDASVRPNVMVQFDTDIQIDPYSDPTDAMIDIPLIIYCAYTDVGSAARQRRRALVIALHVIRNTIGRWADMEAPEVGIPIIRPVAVTTELSEQRVVLISTAFIVKVAIDFSQIQ
jgi:hypothetical protein